MTVPWFFLPLTLLPAMSYKTARPIFLLTLMTKDILSYHCRFLCRSLIYNAVCETARICPGSLFIIQSPRASANQVRVECCLEGMDRLETNTDMHACNIVFSDNFSPCFTYEETFHVTPVWYRARQSSYICAYSNYVCARGDIKCAQNYEL